MTQSVSGREGRTVAALDLGSNSFHMVVARWAGGGLHVVDKLRERVALAAGLDAKRRLDAETQQRAIACLERFGQRLREMPGDSVRAVGTNTLRQLRDGSDFVERAARALGHEIEIISGKEEARLIYLGVAHDVAHDAGSHGGRRLVVDIGGGSTECIIGEDLEVLECDSLYMGCVSYSTRYFAEGRLSRRRMEKARLAARRELESIRRRYGAVGWDHAIGSSGTILAVERILVAEGWSERHITARALRKLRKRLQNGGRVGELSLAGLSEERRDVIAGGVAVLSGVFDSLGIEVMETSQHALREGLLYDLLGRIEHADLRDHTVRQLQLQYHVDREQAARVERAAISLLGEVAKGWGLEGATERKMLAWAARIHEAGLSIARSGYHRHGAYIVAHSDLPGFSREDQQTLAALVRGHRRRIRTELFEGLARPRRKTALRLAVLLRVARRLCRSRGAHPPLPVEVTASGSTIALRFDDGWLDEHPLTGADLEEEAALLRDAGITLSVR